jgi:hypothetical protein
MEDWGWSGPVNKSPGDSGTLTNAEQIRQEFAACRVGPLRDLVTASFGEVELAAGEFEVALSLLQPGFVGSGPIGTNSNLARALLSLPFTSFGSPSRIDRVIWMQHDRLSESGNELPGELLQVENAA